MLNLQTATTPKTSTQAEKNLTQVVAELETASEQLAALEAERDSVLIGGDDAAVDAHDQDIRTTRRRVDRLEAAKGMLERRQEELADDETKAAARKELGIARKAAAREVKQLEEYQGHAQAIAALIEECAETHRTIEKARQTAEEAGLDPEEYGDVQPACVALSTPNEYVPAVTRTRKVDLGALGMTQGRYGPRSGVVEEEEIVEDRKTVYGRRPLNLCGGYPPIQLPNGLDTNEGTIVNQQ